MRTCPGVDQAWVPRRLGCLHVETAPATIRPSAVGIQLRARTLHMDLRTSAPSVYGQCG
jgi:hypothetical protein